MSALPSSLLQPQVIQPRGSQSVAPGPAAAASHGSLLEMQIFKPLPRSTGNLGNKAQRSVLRALQVILVHSEA